MTCSKKARWPDHTVDHELGERQELLEELRVINLLSPPYWPRYNGACESGVGTLKGYTHHQAALCDRPGRWTCDDLEAARLRANELSRPRGEDGPTPDALWQSRQTIPIELREWFVETVAVHLKHVEEEFGVAPGTELEKQDRAAMVRLAITRALDDMGYLEFRRKRISTPNTWRKLSKIPGG